MGFEPMTSPNYLALAVFIVVFYLTELILIYHIYKVMTGKIEGGLCLLFFHLLISFFTYRELNNPFFTSFLDSFKIDFIQGFSFEHFGLAMDIVSPYLSTNPSLILPVSSIFVISSLRFIRSLTNLPFAEPIFSQIKLQSFPYIRQRHL